MEWTQYKVLNELKITGFYSFFVEEYENTYVFAGETHNFWECVYVISGSICVTADENVYNLSAGDIVFHKPRELHKLRATGEENPRLFIVSFSAEGDLLDCFNNKLQRLDDTQKNIIFSMIDYAKMRLSKYDSKEYVFERLFPEYDSSDRVFLPTIASYLTCLFYSILNSMEAIPVSMSYDASLFREAVNYMNMRVCESISICELSKAIGASHSTLKRIYKKYSGLGIHKYFLKLKIKYASELLEKGFSVTEVSNMLGFSSQGYFTNTFKREFGTNPSALFKR